ncbi:MAG: 50S ribosomal protein L5 [Verrucomicrobiales bacterium]
METTMLKEYKEKVVPALREKNGYTNVHQVPRIEKVVLNCCVGKAAERKQAVEDAAAELALITGQKPVVTKAKISVSNFKLRQGEIIGAKVTLRGHVMYEFLERLIRMAIPKIRDFRGVPRRSFDGHGNYTLGINDQTVFPEVELDKVKQPLGFDISIVTTARTDSEARDLLSEMGMPFRKDPKAAEPEAA